MIDEINGPGHGHLDRLARNGKTNARETGRAPGGEADSDAAELEVSGELRSLIERIKAAETYRKDRVHQVLEKLQRGELVTSEAVREAAERILQEGP